MTRLRVLLFRLWALVRSRQADRDIDDEIAGHLAEAKEDYVRRGLSPEDAHKAALRSFGGVAQVKEVYGEVRSFTWLEDLKRDILYAVATFRRAPLAALTIVATVGIGLGLVGAVFTFFNVFFLRVDEVRNPEELFAVMRPMRSSRPLPSASYRRCTQRASNWSARFEARSPGTRGRAARGMP